MISQEIYKNQPNTPPPGSGGLINSIQDEIIEEFELFDDWADKYEYIIDLGKKLKPFPEEAKTEENIIKGCQSRVWLNAKKEGENLVFEADSEAIIVKGLVALLIRILSNHKPKEIANADLYFIDKIGMTSHLAQTRSNGLASMVKQMKNYGIAFESLSNK
jgi:cysteine desulfuration protein SufE